MPKILSLSDIYNGLSYDEKNAPLMVFNHDAVAMRPVAGVQFHRNGKGRMVVCLSDEVAEGFDLAFPQVEPPIAEPPAEGGDSDA